jgi:hypothetical protein
MIFGKACGASCGTKYGQDSSGSLQKTRGNSVFLLEEVAFREDEPGCTTFERFSANAQMLRSWLSGREKISLEGPVWQVNKKNAFAGGEGACMRGNFCPGVRH